ncbi:hypothetical protein NKR23_g4340 [Pleurostoma richardsiae]|uniref:Uncharacterized protein n=1 Tax=Pleurostoma richardsiae TaxID=41990 RepID=A0AA38RGI4_9PEZI|nr:hypothetical protein NKR23_g4340 [Pleurostoma richardsiae]
MLSALVRGSIEFIRMLNRLDLPESFRNNWIPQDRELVSVQGTMNHLTQADIFVDNCSDGFEAHASLVDLLDETFKACGNVVSNPCLAGISSTDEELSQFPNSMPETPARWFNVYPAAPSTPVFFSDFNAYATQYDLANYIDYKLRSKPPLERVESAQELFAAAFTVYELRRTRPLLASERVVEVLLSNGGSPDKVMSRYAKAGNEDEEQIIEIQYTPWMDLVEAGYGSFGPSNGILFRHRQAAFGFRPILWHESQRTKHRPSSFLQWLQLVLLLLEYGANVNEPVRVSIKRPVPVDVKEADRDEVTTAASVLELILKLQPGSETRAKDLVKKIKKHIQGNVSPLATEDRSSP